MTLIYSIFFIVTVTVALCLVSNFSLVDSQRSSLFTQKVLFLISKIKVHCEKLWPYITSQPVCNSLVIVNLWLSGKVTVITVLFKLRINISSKSPIHSLLTAIYSFYCKVLLIVVLCLISQKYVTNWLSGD